jgi:hypothetical protein
VIDVSQACEYNNLQRLDVGQLRLFYERSRRRLFVLDYDGTLVSHKVTGTNTVLYFSALTESHVRDIVAAAAGLSPSRAFRNSYGALQRSLQHRLHSQRPHAQRS